MNVELRSKVPVFISLDGKIRKRSFFLFAAKILDTYFIIVLYLN